MEKILRQQSISNVKIEDQCGQWIARKLIKYNCRGLYNIWCRPIVTEYAYNDMRPDIICHDDLTEHVIGDEQRAGLGSNCLCRGGLLV
ncbi:hypothetical protein KIN20_018636 [Parelaphostrongylus tenuis]|uniref:Uncharacterized protein n=1 Tax=Parelaphostrongylus tenuis TaxID=148309 RepID=A0AAD5MQ72_PARTN|nr:hypothetical protein KIN20_018636 [Parelaphostrongylus tenuis]